MTSKISFFKLIREDIKRKTWLIVLAVLVFFISFPVVLMLAMDILGRYSSYYSEVGAIEQEAKNTFLILMGYQNVWMCVITFVGSALCGIASFSYLYNKKKVDFYHSIPVRREKLFLVSYINGLLIYLIPYLVSIFVCILIGSQYFTMDAAVWGVVWRTFGVQVLFYLMLYHTAMLSAVLAGNMFGCIFLNGMIQFYSILVYGIYMAYCNTYFNTYTSFGIDILGDLGRVSPVMAFINTIEKLLGENGIYQLRLRDGMDSIQLYLMQCFLVVVLVFIVAAYLYKIRSSEMAGKAIAFPKIQPILRILFVIPCAMAGGWIFVMITDYNEIGWMLFGIVFVAALVHGMIEVLYQSDIRGIFSHKIQLAGTIAVTVLIALTFRNDLLGYDKYLPKEGKIESAAIVIQGVADGEEYYLRDLKNERMYSLSSWEYVMEEMKLTGDMIPVVYQLMSLGAETKRTGEIVESIEDWVSISVKVRLKNKTEVMRSYTIPLEKAYDLLCTVFNSTEYKEKTYASFIENYEKADIVSVYGIGKSEELSKKEGRELLEIYQRELMELRLEDIREYPIIGKIVYRNANDSWYWSNEVQLYPTMTESLAYLEKIGITDQILFLAQPKVEDMVAIRVEMNYDYTEAVSDEWGYSYMQSKWKQVEITDLDQMEQLCKDLYFCAGRENWLFWESVYDWNVEVALNPELSQKYYGVEKEYLTVEFQSERDVPDWLRELVLEMEEVE